MIDLSQPALLQNMALDAVVGYILQRCDQIAAEGSWEKFSQYIFSIRKNVGKPRLYVNVDRDRDTDTYVGIPPSLLADFSNKFSEKFCSEGGPTWQNKAALEMIMYIDIVGLRCKGPFLKHLDLEHFPATASLNLVDIYLKDLTTFVFAKKCTDPVLKVTGENCPNLQILKVRDSEVTDEGLRALSPCSKLRVVHVVGCPVSISGVNHLLSVHKNLEEFAFGDKRRDLNPSDLDSQMQCPSVTRLVIESSSIKDEHLSYIVARFPDLTHLQIHGEILGDLHTLECLDKLTRLELGEGINDFSQRETWENLKGLLELIGTNITALKIPDDGHGLHVTNDDLNFIYKFCPNIEHLHFNYPPSGGLVNPPFQKLKNLSYAF